MAAYALAQSWSTLTPIFYVVKLYGFSIAYIVHQCTPPLHKESTDSLIRICNIYSGLMSPTGYYGLNPNYCIYDDSISTTAVPTAHAIIYS